jgi:hypothetical protein
MMEENPEKLNEEIGFLIEEKDVNTLASSL